MDIAIIGTGHVGGTLGRRFADLGHHVVFGVRDVSSGSASIGGGDGVPSNARVATVRDAVAQAGVILVATPWDAVPRVLQQLEGALDGKVLLDATNPLLSGLRMDTVPDGASGAERIQRMVPNARVVKIFNTTGYDNMRNPSYGGEPTVMFHAGDDAGAKRIAGELSAALGFDAIDAGPLVRARELEHLALLWISLATRGMGRDIAFRLVRR